jgi:hypothetical protein
MKRKIGISMIILSALLITACAAFPSPLRSEPAGPAAPTMAVAAPAATMAPAPTQIAGERVSKDIGPTTNTVDRIVIKNASLSLAVVDPVATSQSITNMAEGMGGFVVSSNVYKTSSSEGVELPAADIAIRVPSEKLEDILNQIKDLVPDAKTDILNENISGQDVTKEYTDTESRLNNLKAAEMQLVKILASATKTEDVMTVFRELTSVREQIEVLQGQLNYYKDAARLSAISINLKAKESLKPITVAGWQPGLEVQKSLQSLVKGLTLLVNLLIFILIVLVPFVLIIGLPVYLIVRAVRRRRQTDKPAESKAPVVNKK